MIRKLIYLDVTNWYANVVSIFLIANVNSSRIDEKVEKPTDLEESLPRKRNHGNFQTHFADALRHKRCYIRLEPFRFVPRVLIKRECLPVAESYESHGMESIAELRMIYDSRNRGKSAGNLSISGVFAGPKVDRGFSRKRHQPCYFDKRLSVNFQFLRYWNS